MHHCDNCYYYEGDERNRLLNHLEVESISVIECVNDGCDELWRLVKYGGE